jgi:hypothetical protein
MVQSSFVRSSPPSDRRTTTIRTRTVRGGIFLIVLVLALPARKAIDHDHDDDEGNPVRTEPHPALPPGGRAKIALLDRVSVF